MFLLHLQLYVLTNQSVSHCVEYKNLYEKKVQLIKNTLKQTKFGDKTVKSTHLSLGLISLHWPP